MYVTRDVIKKPFIIKGFNINTLQHVLAEREGFEPSKGFLNPYSLSRGAPSAARPPLQMCIDHFVEFSCSSLPLGARYFTGLSTSKKPGCEAYRFIDST
jgi:hypothetical protein